MVCRMSTFVTLAEVLESRGAPLEEDEVWALLLGATEVLIDISSKDPGNMCLVISPGSMLLSTSGSIAFKTCSRSEDMSSFTSPEMSQRNSSTRRQAKEKMVVYSLGMTLYWTVDYQLPQNQPVQLSDNLNSLLLSMCEDVALKRVNLLTVLETCEQHHKNALLSRPERVIRQMSEDVLQVEKPPNDATRLTDRSQMVRERLRGASCQNFVWLVKGNSTPSQADFNSCHSSQQRSCNSTWLTQSPCLDRHHLFNSRTNQLYGSSVSLNGRKIKGNGPEFIRMLEEPLVILELPNSIVSNRGRSSSNQRDLTVIMPNGQNILIKCDVKSRGGDVFDMIIAHSNLVEHFYFGLAYSDDDEFFFLDNETKISKVAPYSWKKVPTSTFVLHFRVKFFVNDISLLLNKLTCHQYYLQLRRDILEDRLPCNEETCLFLGALALQAEFGDSMPEVYGKNYYQPEHYVSKRVLQKMAMPCLKEELLRLHANNANMVADESELEFLKTIQQLPEYGVLFHRVTREKKPVFEELVLGVCAKGIIVYEVINNSRTASLRFQWRETTSITSTRCKFVIESSTNKKKHTFLTENSKVAKYLCNLCSAQHKFHKEMSSRQLSHSLASEESIVQYAAMCRAQNNLTSRLSEVALNDGRLNTTPDDSMSKLCEDIAMRIETKIKQQRDLLDHTGSQSPFQQRSYFSSQKRCSEVPSMSSAQRDTIISRPPEREIICVTLKKDPKGGLGIVIVGEDNTGRLDLGIFIASVVPGGPADNDGRIKPGGRLISLNQISLEGVSFSEAANIMQNSSNEVELIVSQQKGLNKCGGSGNLAERSYDSQSTILVDNRAGDDDLDELVSVMMTPKSMSRLHVPEVRIVNAQDDYSRSSSLISLRPEEFIVMLRKSGGSLGISIAGGVNTSLRYGGIYIKSLVPGGAAEQDGQIQPGDRLLEVDGIRLQGLTDQQAAECLARTGEVVSLILERDGGSVLPRGPASPRLGNMLTVHKPAPVGTQMRNSCPAITMTRPFVVKHRDYSFVSDDNILEVTLKKRLNGLGFSFFVTELDTSLDCGNIVRIRTLFPGQPAEESGKIQEGDVILSINGEPLKGLSYQRVIPLLRNSSSEVHLVLCRPAEGTLPPISEKIGQLTCS
ncbi:tyrosine-protein phosphatase non-receptor type 13 [Xyrauchen texanus]|uniref:tyrosine-protein phosphatase non-receptor type 13 n=1 Tax=Xyrauchen texanus TaxID=154827 RepID=UPI002242A968|nr:tyrosine-protein phosphatase non-receptor type 13 [Xyrauchen texanus]